MARAWPRTDAPLATSPRCAEPPVGFPASASNLLSVPQADSALQAASMVGKEARSPAQYCRGGGDASGGAISHPHFMWIAGCAISPPQFISSHSNEHRAWNRAMKILYLVSRSRAEVPRGPPACLTEISGRVPSPFPTSVYACFFNVIAYYCSGIPPPHYSIGSIPN